MGPLSKLWLALEEAKSSDGQEAPLSINDILFYVEQTVLLVGQSHNTLSYHRRLNVLSNVMGELIPAKSMLRDKAEQFQQNTDEKLFGTEFRTHLTDTVKAKKQTKEVFLGSMPKRSPFRHGPSPKQRGGGRFVYFPKENNRDRSYSNRGGARFQSNSANSRFNNNNNTNRNNFFKRNRTNGKKRSKFLQQIDTSDTLLDKIGKGSSNHKKVVFNKTNSRKHPSGRQVKPFHKIVGTSHKRPEYIIPSKRVSNTISYRTFPGKNIPQSAKNVKGERGFNKHRGERFVEEGSYFESFTSKAAISKQSIPSTKKGWELQACDKFKAAECTYPLSTFQNGKFALFERCVKKGRLHVQIRPEGCLLLCPPRQTVQEICQISMVRQSLRIPVSLLRNWSSSSNLYEVVKDSNFNIASYKYTNDRLPRRYVNYGGVDRRSYYEQGHSNLPVATFGFVLNRRSYYEQGHSNLPVATFGVCFEPKEINNASSPSHRVSRSERRLTANENLSSRGKNFPDKREMFTPLHKPQNIDLKLTKLIGHLTSTIQAILPARLQCRFLQQQQIQALKSHQSYQKEIVLNQDSKVELLWWVENLSLSNGCSLICPETQVVIQTDASLTGWGAVCNGQTTRESGHQRNRGII